MLTLYNVISSDGFIAAKDGSEDFIPDAVWGDFLELCANYDALVMGKRTYNAIQGYEKELVEPFEKLGIKKIVMTRDKDFHPKHGYMVLNSLKKAAALYPNMLLSSGPSLNTAFLKENLIDRVVLNEIPTTVGGGIRQFEEGVSPRLVPMPELCIDKGNGRKLFFYNILY